MNISLFRNGKIDPNSVDILFSQRSASNYSQPQQTQSFIQSYYNSYDSYNSVITTSAANATRRNNSSRHAKQRHHRKHPTTTQHSTAARGTTRTSTRPPRLNPHPHRRVAVVSSHYSTTQHQRPTQQIVATASGSRRRSEDEEDDDEGDSTTDGGVESDQKKAGKSSRRAPRGSQSRKSFTDELDAFFASAHSELNAFSVRFAFCEALASHGYNKEAFRLAKELAMELLQNPPNTINSFMPRHSEEEEAPMLMDSGPEEGFEEDFGAFKYYRSGPNRSTHSNSTANNQHHHHSFSKASNHQQHNPQGFVNVREHKISELVATTLSRTIFLVKVLANGCDDKKEEERQETLSSKCLAESTTINAFIIEVALKILKNPRGPAATRYLEVYIHSLENQLFQLLNDIQIREKELLQIRTIANNYFEELQSDAATRIVVPPIEMAHYLYQALSGLMPTTTTSNTLSNQLQYCSRELSDLKM